MPAGMGVTPIKEYLQAIVDTVDEGTVSIELEYAPEGTEIVPWAQRAYDGTAAIMREVGVRRSEHTLPRSDQAHPERSLTRSTHDL